MLKFHPATVVEKRPEGEDALCITLQVPEEFAAEYRYREGQHLPLRAEVNGKKLRRTYSICAGVDEQVLRLGIRIQPDGQFSNYVASEVNVGDTLEIMPPIGQFHVDLDPGARRNYAAFVAGSGITPILSIIQTTLSTEPESRFHLFYGNRRRSTAMFIDELWELKNRFMERLSLHFFMSQEPNEIELYAGRIDAGRVQTLYRAFLAETPPDDIFICGPNPMIDDVSKALTDIGFPDDHIHTERFRGVLRDQPAPRRAAAAAAGSGTQITVVMDGERRSFNMPADAESVLDAAQSAGIDLPYSCTGGVCSTCRTRLVSGEVDMAVNYALEPWELERGFILACQARPTTAEVELDYDQA